MLYHLVLLRLKEGHSSEELSRLQKGLDSLTQIPGVEFVRHGSNVTDLYPGYLHRTKGHSYSLLVGLTDAKDLKKYDESDLHVQVKTACIGPILDKTEGRDSPVLAVDWESPSVTPTQTRGAISIKYEYILGAALLIGGIYVSRSRL